MKFIKMHGAGNDYVFVDCFKGSLDGDLPALAREISDRHFGVGADGLILIHPSDQADARMQMFNADGSEAEMCGNGIRCVGKYVYEQESASRIRSRSRPVVVSSRCNWNWMATRWPASVLTWGSLFSKRTGFPPCCWETRS